MKKILLAVCFMLPLSSVAQTCTDVKLGANGNYTVRIDNKKFVAYSEKNRKALIELTKGAIATKEVNEGLTKQIDKLQKMNDEYETLRKKYQELTNKYEEQTKKLSELNGKYSETAGKLVELNGDYSKTIKRFDGLVDKYREIALRSVPRNPVDVGFGIMRVNDVNRGVFMAGAGMDITDNWHIRGWLYGGEETLGAMVGLSF